MPDEPTKDPVEKLVDLLGGWPRHFRVAERQHGISLLTALRRDRLIDEPVFGLVCRYAVHRAAWDKLSTEIRAEAKLEVEESPGHYLSGKEQSRAFHENKLLTLERELLATPYAKARQGRTPQTSFMDLLEKTPVNDGGSGKVTPFTPLGKRGNAG